MFLILEKSEAHALEKVVLKKKACYLKRLNKSGRDKEKNHDLRLTCKKIRIESG